MRIIGMEGMTGDKLAHELSRGARFVIYQYCISIIVMTFKRSTDIHFIPAGRGAVGPGVGASALSAVLGWWGIPWGPIYTVQSLVTNFQGGKDVTAQVVAALQQGESGVA